MTATMSQLIRYPRTAELCSLSQGGPHDRTPDRWGDVRRADFFSRRRLSHIILVDIHFHLYIYLQRYHTTRHQHNPNNLGPFSAQVGQLGRKGQHGNRGLNRSSRFESNNEHKHNSNDLEALRISLLVHYYCVHLRSHEASTTSAKEADGECSLAAELVEIPERYR
jgi:hypothetical protein